MASLHDIGDLGYETVDHALHALSDVHTLGQLQKLEVGRGDQPPVRAAGGVHYSSPQALRGHAQEMGM